MITFSHLREFITFAKYLSISKAADALFISQSSLSKHLKQLEAEVGFELTYKKSGQLFLTDEGGHFLGGVQSVLSDYDELLRECQMIKDNTFTKLVMQDPPFSDVASAAFYSIVNDIQNSSPSVRIDFAHERYRDRQQLLMKDKMHMLMEYHCTDAHQVVKRYAEEGILAMEISREPLVAWGRKTLFEGVDELETHALRELSVILSSDASSPMSTLLAELPEVLGFSPRIFISPARSATQYYYSNHKKGVFLIPRSHSSRKVFSSREDMRVVPFKGNPLLCRVFALVNGKGEHLDILKSAMENAELPLLPDGE